MNILYCTLHINSNGGAGQSACKEIEYLSSHGVDVHVVTTQSMLPHVKRLGVTYTLLKSPHRSCFSFLYFLWQLHYFSRSWNDYEMLYCNDKEFGFFPLKRYTGKIITYFRGTISGAENAILRTHHTISLGRRLSNILLRYLENRLIRASATLLCKSKSIKSELQHYYSAGCKSIEVIPGGIDSTWLLPLSTHSRIYPLVFLGRIVQCKGLHLLLEALSKVQTKCELYVFGEFAEYTSARNRKYKSEIQILIEEYDLKVHFMGWISPEQVRGVLLRTETLIMPSLYEPFGLVALEAVACGCKVVVSSYAGITEVLPDSDNIMSVLPDRTEALKSAIKHMLHTQWVEDDQMCLQSVTWDEVGRKTLAALHQVISK